MFGAAKRLRKGLAQPAGLIILLVVGVGLLVGAPLLAEDPADPAQTDHGAATGHEDTPGEVAHGAEDADHGEGEHEESAVQHFPTLVGIMANVFEGKQLHGLETAAHPASRFLLKFEDVIYSLILIFLLGLLFSRASRNMTLVPGKLQNFAEAIVGGLDQFICNVIGPEGRRFVPFLGTLGLYIYVMNIFGLIPLMKSPTSVLNTTTLPNAAWASASRARRYTSTSGMSPR